MQEQTVDEVTEKSANRLIHQTSPYLLQHAYNPVNWYPWGDEAWDRAKAENKLVIISIGYSACHWCHVMEHESFENAEIAALMNKNYICIKVDREERPDVDQFFMDACQLMVGRGGWPLNAFALPDKRPVYAGTYFPTNQWKGLLHELANGYRFKKQSYLEYADKLTAGIRGLSRPVSIAEEDRPEADLDYAVTSAYQSMERIFDRRMGGKGQAPKFPMPDNYLFLLRYHKSTGEAEALKQTLLTLNKMAGGGIYDQIGGGFCRYSTDAEWKVPHFEKMLYDNAQLISLYSQAYTITQDSYYKDIVFETIAWMRHEMHAPEGVFYAALDADSEGEEGKYYLWTESEIRAVLDEPNAGYAINYFGIGKQGLWEQGRSIPVAHHLCHDFSRDNHIRHEDWCDKLDIIKGILYKEREKRIRPGLDNKILTSWNALAIIGLCDAYQAFSNTWFFDLAKDAYHFIEDKLLDGTQLYRTYSQEKPAIRGFLEDYALLIKAQIRLYQVTFDEKFLLKASELLQHLIRDFYDPESGFFYFTDASDTDLPVRKIDTGDNVIASPNSIMGQNLYTLGRYFSQEEWISMARRIVAAMIPSMSEHGSFFSNYALLALDMAQPERELCILGDDALNALRSTFGTYRPDVLIAGSKSGISALPMLANKYQAGQTQYYLCENRSCHAPVTELPAL